MLFILWTAIIFLVAVSLFFLIRWIIDKFVAYLDKINDIITVLDYADDESEYCYIQSVYGALAVCLAEKYAVQNVVNHSNSFRNVWKCYRKYGYAVAMAVREFNSHGLAMNAYTYRGYMPMTAMLQKDEVVRSLTSPATSSQRRYLRMYMNKLTKRVFIAWGMQMYSIGDVYLYDAIKKDGFTLVALRRYVMLNTIPDAKEVLGVLKRFTKYKYAIEEAPKLGSLARPFSYDKWCESRKAYNSIRKSLNHYKEYVNHGFAYLISSDYKGDRWPAAMGELTVCNPELYDQQHREKEIFNENS